MGGGDSVGCLQELLGDYMCNKTPSVVTLHVKHLEKSKLSNELQEKYEGDNYVKRVHGVYCKQTILQDEIDFSLLCIIV